MPQAFAIWPENVESFAAFARAATQWRFIVLPFANGGARIIRTGLDHAALAATIGFAKRASKRLRDLFDDCLAMEDAALAAFAEADR